MPFICPAVDCTQYTLITKTFTQLSLMCLQYNNDCCNSDSNKFKSKTTLFIELFGLST